MAITITCQQRLSGIIEVWWRTEDRDYKLFDLDPATADIDRLMIEESAAEADSLAEFLEVMVFEAILSEDECRTIREMYEPSNPGQSAGMESAIT